jgi:uncharacterized membrane protein YphA (DoxX/SURF4 family)
MDLVRRIAHPLLAGMFIAGGLDSVQHPETKVEKAERVAPRIARPLPLPQETVQLVRINGAVQVAAGTLLAIGRLPRLAALALIGSLVPTTLAGHPFWEEDEPQARAGQRIHFLKNLAMIGGLLLAAVDTGGRPSVPWTTSRATRRAAAKVGERLHLGD